jgi:hypothetical protein
MPEDEPDAMGLGVPPQPVAYLGPLILGLLLNRRIPAPFLPRGLTRMLGLPLISGGVLLGGWTYRMMRRANTPITGEPFVAGKPTTSLVTQGPFRYTRNPGNAAHDATHRDRARRTLPGGQVRRGIPKIQGTGTPLDLAVLG